MKQTSIEWLIQEIQTKHDKSFIEFYGAEIEQAKEIHKQEIIEAFDLACEDENRVGKEYYNETYNK